MDSDVKLKHTTARLSIFSNTFLVVSKLTIGLLTGTVSLISEAIHSGMDLLAAGITFVAVKKASAPPDKEHDYGHGKIENVSASVEAVLIIMAALYIVYEAAEKFSVNYAPQSLNLAILVMLASSLINSVVSRRLYAVGERTGSEALKADGMHLKVDVWTSVAVLFGIILIKVTGLYWIDPLMACLVAIGILRVGYKMCRDNYDNLIDASLSESEESDIGRIILNTAGVIGYHHLRTRKAGNVILMDFHLEVDESLPLHEAHAISQKVEDNLRQTYDSCDPVIHIEPR